MQVCLEWKKLQPTTMEKFPVKVITLAESNLNFKEFSNPFFHIDKRKEAGDSKYSIPLSYFSVFSNTDIIEVIFTL